jgi:serine/threonine-protein kinase
MERGAIVGSYVVEDSLGRGGMGVVYRARHVHLDRPVALKLLSAELSGSPEFAERFRREGRLQASLEHPHIVTVYEAGESEHGLYLAMRLVEGPTLALLLQAGGVDAARAVEILRQVGSALDAAHAAGLVHRDVKPQNIFVEGDDAYLGDFGLVRSGALPGATAPGRLVGTVAYLAPEVIGGGDARPAADRYALAAVAFECLTGTPVYPRGTDAAVLHAHASEPPPRASDRRPELPVALDGLFAGALAKDPAERPDRAEAVADAIAAALEGAQAGALGPPQARPSRIDGETTESPARAPQTSGRTPRRLTAWIALAAAAGAAAALAGAALIGDDASDAGAAVPAPLPRARVLGSDLRRPGRTLDCLGRRPHLTSPQCTIRQVALPDASLVVPEDGVVRRWAVRSARGELSLAVLRPRDGGVLQIARSQNEFVENDGVFSFPANLAVERGDVLGLVVIGGSGVGVRPVDGATTERWLPHVASARAPDFTAGHGLDDELLLRVDYIPGGRQRQPHQVRGPAAAALPAGHVIARAGRHFADGRPVAIDIVEAGGVVAVDEVIAGKRFARLDLPGFAPGGRVITFHADPSPDFAEDVEIYIEYASEDSTRVFAHYVAADQNGFVFVD